MTPCGPFRVEEQKESGKKPASAPAFSFPELEMRNSVCPVTTAFIAYFPNPF